MINIISSLFPQAKIITSPENFLYNGLISININEEVFFIELLYNVMPYSIIQDLEILLTSQCTIKTTVHFIDGIEFYKNSNDKFTGTIEIDKQKLQVFLSLESSIYFAKRFNLIQKNYQKSTILDLYRELFRFSPQLIQKTSWNQFEDQQLENLFNQMLFGQLATVPMLALFFKNIDLASPAKFFSKRISQELEQELKKLSNSENKYLLESIHYIIERNIILFFLENSTSILSEYYNTFLTYHQYFLYESIRNFHLNSLKCIQQSQSQSNFPLFIQKIPHFSLVTFLKLSPSENLQIIKEGFSESGFSMLNSDITNSSEQILSYRTLLKQLALFEYKALGLTFEKAVHEYLTQPRDWEFLAREVDIRKLFISLDSLEKIPKTLSGMIANIYHFYKKKELIFPNLTKILPSEALESCTVNILYIKFLNLLSIKNKSDKYS